MAWVIDQCLILLHPTMPFITEELWGEIASRRQDAGPCRLARLRRGADRCEADREMTWVIGLIDEIRSVRAQMHVPAGLEGAADAGGAGCAGQGPSTATAR
jgi:valyl-tRNA synthetase